MSAYALISKIPEDVAMIVAKYDGTKREHKKKFSKCFSFIYDVAKYECIVCLPNGETGRFNWGMTIWDVTDYLMSFMILLANETGPMSIRVHLPTHREGLFLNIVDRDKGTEDCFKYFKTILYMIGGLKNLDIFAFSADPDLKEAFFEQRIECDDDIDEALYEWKQIAKLPPDEWFSEHRSGGAQIYVTGCAVCFISRRCDVLSTMPV